MGLRVQEASLGPPISRGPASLILSGAPTLGLERAEAFISPTPIIRELEQHGLQNPSTDAGLSLEREGLTRHALGPELGKGSAEHSTCTNQTGESRRDSPHCGLHSGSFMNQASVRRSWVFCLGLQGSFCEPHLRAEPTNAQESLSV